MKLKQSFLRVAFAFMAMFFLSTQMDAAIVSFVVKCPDGTYMSGFVTVTEDELASITKYSTVILNKAFEMCGCNELCNITVTNLNTTQEEITPNPHP